MSLQVPEAVLLGSLPLKAPKDVWSGPYGEERLERTCQVVWTPGDAGWGGVLPSAGSALSWAPWMRFVDFSAKQKGKCAELTLVYEQIEGTGLNLPELPLDTCSEDVAGLELDITRHPRFHDANPAWSGMSMFDLYNPLQDRIFWEEEVPPTYENAEGITVPHPKAGEDVPLEIRGMSRYLVGSMTVVCRNYSYNQPASVQGVVGTQDVPSGYSGTGNWLIVSASRVPQVGYWCRSVTYQYSAKAISSFVYP